MSTLRVFRLSNDSQLPVRASPGAAGYDLISSEHVLICAKSRKVVPTGIVIELPPGTYGRIAPRSGLAVKHCIDVAAGVIDSDYRGPIGVVLCNNGDTDFEVEKGDRIAQLILEQIITPDIVEPPGMTITLRGDNGFGSTGR